MSEILEVENTKKKYNNYELMKKVINNEFAYDKRDGIVYSHLRDLSGFFTRGKINISEDRKTFEIEISGGELNQTIYKDFENYFESKIHQFRNFMSDYNEKRVKQ